MRAIIMPLDNHIRIDDEPLTVAADLMPAGPALEGFDASRPIEAIHFDGAIGMIQQRSRAPGRHDITHFLGADPLKPYAEVFLAEQTRLADEKKKANQQAEAQAQHAAELAAQAETDFAKKGG